MEHNRTKTIASLRANPAVSVLIIGAGINGIGTFRDLALQGVDVLLVDKGDFCAGASAASSHMVHGGIRYLENGEFRLVREAVHERNRLIQNAPHLVRPLATNIPIFSTFSGLLNAPLKFLGLLDKPGERGRFIIKAGLMMYDAYTREQGGRAVPPHKVIGQKEAVCLYPKLNPDVAALATYYDAAMPMPERIGLEIVLDAQHETPAACALNYMAAVGAEGNGVRLRDELTGDEITVQPQLVINAGGPWIDFVNKALGVPTEFIGGTKGSHLVLDHPELYAACDGHEFFFENDDGRIVLIYPVNGRVMVGTSDIKIDDPEDAVCTAEEADYFMAFVQKIFPTIEVRREHIVFQFSGVRPLPNSKSKTTGQISRDHSNEMLEPDQFGFAIFNLVGGKWTTFRAFAEQVTDAALARLQRPRTSSTAELPIGGGKAYPRTARAVARWVADVVGETGLAEARVGQLFERYGTYGAEFARFMAAEPDQPLANHADYSVREIQFLIRHEQVARLDDVLLRRTPLGMYGHLSRPLIEEVGGLVAAELGWETGQLAAELERTFALLAERHGMVY
jgi:glycerol-3-phosphate dehydrogenase